MENGGSFAFDFSPFFKDPESDILSMTAN